jgi:hypothetical protein
VPLVTAAPLLFAISIFGFYSSFKLKSAVRREPAQRGAQERRARRETSTWVPEGEEKTEAKRLSRTRQIALTVVIPYAA